MMKPFNILCREVNIHSNYLLEASAGTGKTFSIEHIVVRLLIEEKPLTLDQILLVTFTKAATRDLKMRVRGNIDKMLNILEGSLPNERTPDYIQAIVEQGSEEVQKCKKRLENALLCFEQAQIYTIHGFCLRMLCDHGFPLSDDPVPPLEIVRLLRDFFRTEFTDEHLSPMQMKVLLKNYQNSVEKLEKSLLAFLMSGREVQPQPNYSEQLVQINHIRTKLQSRGFSSSQIIESFITLAPQFKGLCDRSRKIKDEVIERVERFAGLFDYPRWEKQDYEWLIEDQLFLPLAFEMKNKAAKSNVESDHPFLAFLKEIKQALSLHVHPSYFFAKIAGDCQKKLHFCLREMERYRYDDLLKMLLESLSNQTFAQQIRSRYGAAIIDEFQDTDPLQWHIFKHLFLEGNQGNLYLVGDPKQSIYSFRQADIYTYLDAARSIGEGHHGSLRVNYRSQPPLIKALNMLFSESIAPGLMALPKLKSTLSVPTVEAAPLAQEVKINDGKGCVHFAVTEQNGTFEKVEQEEMHPFIIQEIQQLMTQHGMRYQNFAILVSDRYQADRIAQSLFAYRIPVEMQKRSSIVESLAFQSLYELLEAVLNPKDLSAIKIALGSKLLGWTDEYMCKLDEEMVYANIVMQFLQFNTKIVKDGFTSFFQTFLMSKFEGNRYSCAENILLQEDGEEFYQDLTHLAEQLSQYQAKTLCPPEALLVYLNSLSMMEANDDPSLAKRIGDELDAVKIMTLHASKGLEFDVIYLLGVSKRTRAPDFILPDQNGILVPIADEEEPIYKSYCLESDAEKMRQFYVAMTRAKNRIYIPVALSKSNSVQGCASLIEIYISHFTKNSSELSSTSFENLSEVLSNLPNVTLSRLQPPYRVKIIENDEYSPPLHAPKKITIPDSNLQISSFSSLAKHREIERVGEVPRDFSASCKSAHTLPGGSDTGTLIHRLYETLPLLQANTWKKKEEFLPFVKNALQGTAYEAWENVFCDRLYHSWNTSIQTPCDQFSLRDVNPIHCFREMEFIYASHEAQYLKGYIDLFFQHDGRYYVVDWKSNWLGPTNDFYQLENLKSAMSHNDYYLQGRIYKQAIQKYISVFEPQAEFNDKFGGILFIFLRGVEEGSGKYGIYNGQWNDD